MKTLDRKQLHHDRVTISIAIRNNLESILNDFLFMKIGMRTNSELHHAFQLDMKSGLVSMRMSLLLIFYSVV